MLFLLYAGCAPPRVTSWCGSDVSSATISESSIAQIAVIGGSLQGTGLLIAERENGDTCETPVALEGGMFGLVVDFIDVLFIAPLEIPEGGVDGAALFGHYDGTSASSVAMGGVTTKHLKNGHGVEIDQPSFGLGVGFGWAYSWLDISVAEGIEYDSGDSGSDE